MILKSLSRKSDSTGQLVEYVMRYVFKEQEIPSNVHQEITQQHSKFIIRHNLRARTSLKSFVREFQENESFRLVKRKDSVRLFHNIISFSNKDKEHITDELLKDIANKFIEERGPTNLFLGTKHEEGVDHIHLHIIVSGTQLNGRSSRVSKQKFHSIKLALDKYQREKYPQLIHSLPEHGKSKRMAKENVIEHIKASRQTNKQALLESLEKIYAQSTSRQDFLQQIATVGYKVYHRNGRLQGITCNEKKFRFSRLGFDDERLQGLDKPKVKIDKSLLLLQQLRDNKSKEVKREIRTSQLQQEAMSTMQDEHTNVLKELSAIRNGRESSILKKDSNESEYERDTSDKESGSTENNLPEFDDHLPTLFDELKHLIKAIQLEV
jgi:hypothetical protein